MKYFLHDSNAFNDEKITELYIKFGYEGLGLFYTALEKFASQEKPIKTEVIKKQLGVGKRLQKCWSFMEEIGIICSSNGESFNKELLKFSEKYQIKKEKNAKRVASFRARHENVMHYSGVSNAPKDNISKVKVSNNIKIGAFAPPTIEELTAFLIDKPTAQDFFDYYSSNGWKVGRVSMKDWKSAARRWERNSGKYKKQENPQNLSKGQLRTQASFEAFEKAREYEKATGKNFLLGRHENTPVSLPDEGI
jgi:hypothetical protein